MQYLLSLPPARAAYFSLLEGYPFPQWFASCDPAGKKLGSGGGTAHLLAAAWRETGQGEPFDVWLAQDKRLMVHGGGDSRRLPAYAAVGKPFLPIPALRGGFGQRLDQTLLDLQLPDYRRLLERAPSGLNTLVTSGDVLLRFGDLPPLPDVDVLACGMQAPPDTAQHFGVFFSSRERPDELAFFLQKPAAARIRTLIAQDWTALVDTGMWLLSERAVLALFACCGWEPERQTFAEGAPGFYELYAQFGLALGAQPQVQDARINGLRSAVVALPRSEFYHLGASRQMIETVGTLQERESRRGNRIVSRIYPDQVVQNAGLAHPISTEHHTLWVENASIPAGWSLTHDHLLTNIPHNDWRLDLPPGVCLDFPPIDADAVCVRAYGIDDRFAGALSAPDTLWLGRPTADWFADRGISWEQAGLDPAADIQLAALFPCARVEELDEAFLAWLFAEQPRENARFAPRWRDLPRLSAREITQRINFKRLQEQQEANRQEALMTLYRNRRSSIFYQLDLQAAAEQFARTAFELPPAPQANEQEQIARMHDHMWRSAVMRRRNQSCWEQEEQEAFACLRQSLLNEVRLTRPTPQNQLLEDQIIWGRAPLRLDLAGGWTDTPPYCLQHGGQVVNVAVDLNGQPPIQVFIKLSKRPEIVLRSIDLGVEQRITAWEDLGDYALAGGEFSLAKAALAQAGFLPSFYGAAETGGLERYLQAFGGGVEISLLAAAPKGSGLGASSILAATLLGALNDLCGLNWDRQAIIRRTLALEQMLTTGGGWQDQAGGIVHGVKRVESRPGPEQTLTYHWLPEHLFKTQGGPGAILLYYTGLTRMAKHILQEIVRGMFLNDRERLGILEEIGANAAFASEAIQQADYELLGEAVRRSWNLNCRLDADTDPPEVQTILDAVGDYLKGAKLLGAGGGGYLLMLAKDPEAAAKVRSLLTDHPPNDRARFMRFSVSQTGLEITRS